MQKFNSQKIIDKYSDMIYQIAIGYLLNQDDAEDIVQEVLLKYIRMQPKFKDENHEKYWIVRVTINMCCNEIHSASKTKNLPYIENTNSIKFETTCEANIFDCIRKLKTGYRRIFELHYLHDMKIGEISKILNIREDAVKTRLKRARDTLKELLRKEHIEQ